MGDFNAKVGQNNTGYKGVMGKYGNGIMNENGEYLAEVCGNNNLVMGGTLFPHKEIHSYGHHLEEQTKIKKDHIVVIGEWRRTIQDVRVRRGADVGSDHHLNTEYFKLKLMKTVPKSNRKIFDTGK